MSRRSSRLPGGEPLRLGATVLRAFWVECAEDVPCRLRLRGQEPGECERKQKGEGEEAGTHEGTQRLRGGRAGEKHARGAAAG